jgi:hypothetical protein
LASNLFGTSAPANSAPTDTVAANPPPPGTLTFDGTFETGITPWTSQGGSAQCANYGTPSSAPRLRGNFYLDTSAAGQGTHSGRFTLPADSNPSTYPLEACDLDTGARPLGLGTDSYSGLMVYVPDGWTIANNAFFGVEIAEYHFQNIDGAPISLQLHPDHVTLALQLGGCNNATTKAPGCQYRSNADTTCTTGSGYTCLPGYYAIPRGAFVEGAWNEILLHVQWAANNTGQIETWYRVAGSSRWNAGAAVSGYPTVQWDNATGCCNSSYVDLTEAYTAALSSPLTLWLDDVVTATGYGAAAAAMP